MLRECPGIFPISEPICISFWITADHSDEGEHEQNEDQDDLASAQPEFDFSIGTNGEEIDQSVMVG